MSDLFDRLQATLGEDTYRLERELGGGGMSQVFLATDVELGRKVVVKVLPPSMAAGVNKERFQREIRLAASLQHPHIVPLLTAGSAGDLIWYIMPYIEGESLRVKLSREGELPVGETVQILSEVMDALSYAHESEVIHRDIKPDNVMISRGHALVMDFGVAKAVSASSGGTASSLTSMGVALGTPAYMSPEQAAADPQVDHRADIYAVGALAYEMLTGRPPFVKQTPQQVLAAQVNEEPDHISSHRKTVPARLADLVMRCLAKRPADRWQNAGDLRSHFIAVVTPDSGGMTPTGTAPYAAVQSGVLGALKVLVDTPLKIAAAYVSAAAFALLFAYAMMIAFGLPDWVFLGAVVLAVIGFPVVMLTGRRELKVAEAYTTGLHVATPVGLEKHLTWKKALTGGGLAFTGLAVVAGGFVGLRSAGIGPAATLVSSGVLEGRSRLIVADFNNRTDDSTLGISVTQALRIDLAQSPVVRVMALNDLRDALTRMEHPADDPIPGDVALELAVREGIPAVVEGEISTLGSGFVISARIIATEGGETLVPVRETASNAGELIDAVDRLSAKLRERIGESLKTIRAGEPLDRVTTSSLEALRLYGRAEQLQGTDPTRAMNMLREAIGIDSTFAMSYRKLAVILSNEGASQSEQNAAASRAYELRERLPPLERYLAAAYYHSEVTRDRDAVIDAYRSALEVDPDSRAALNNLSLWLISLRQWDEAETLLRHGLEVEPIWQLYGNLVRTFTARGMEDQADSVLAEWEAWSPGNVQTAWRKVIVAADRSQLDSALAMNQRIRNEHGGTLRWDRFTSFADAFIYEQVGRFEDRRAVAIRIGEREAALGNSGNALAWALWPIRMLPLVRGPEETRAAIQDVLTAHPLSTIPAVDRPWFDLIVLQARAGQPDAAQDLLSEWNESGVAQAPGVRLRARGEIELAAGRYDDAINTFSRFYEEVGCNSCGLYQIAKAHDLAGRSDSALTWYERAVTVPETNRLIQSSRDLAPAYRRLGELFEDQGDRDKALEYYGRFVDLWENADAELQPLVTDIRGRIARLVGER